MPIQPQPESITLPQYVQEPKILPVGQWLPDLPDYMNPGVTNIINAQPLSPMSYGPVPSLQPVGITGVPSDQQVIGLYHFVDNLGAAHVFAGTTSSLYHLALETGNQFVDATNLNGPYHADLDAPWDFTAFAESVIAVQIGDQPQIMTIGNIEFTPITTAPFAKYATVCRGFLVLGNIIELADDTSYPYRIHWSALGNANNFPPIGSVEAIQAQSDINDFRSDLGAITGLASNLQTADMAIIMEDAIYVGYYVGTPAIFNFQIVQGAVGCRSPQSIVTHRGYSYFLGLDGYYQFDGTSPKPIGANKIDRFFFNDLDISFLDRVQGAADPTGKYIYWLYYGSNHNGVNPNKMLIYNWSLDMWGIANVQAQWIAKSISLGYTMEQLDQFCPPGLGLDGLPFSLDSPAWKGGAQGLYAFDANTMFAHLGGPVMQTTIETMETQPVLGNRCKITSSRPIIDGSTPTIALGHRNRLEDPVIFNNPTPMNIHGECPQYASDRYFRARVTIPRNTLWSHFQGVEIDFNRTTPR